MSTQVAPADTAGPIRLRPYQDEAIAAVLEREAAGVMRQLGVAATGLGKALSDDELVLTPGGWAPIRVLHAADHVIGSDGAPTEVLGVYPQGVQPLYRVTFSDGPQVVCTADHLWTVRTKYDRHRGRPWRVMPLSDIIERGLTCQQGARWFTPVPEPVQHPDQDLPVDPYLLGVLLGDGNLRGLTPYLSTADQEILDEVRRLLPLRVYADHSDGYDYRLTGRVKKRANPLTRELRRLGLVGCGSHTKFIPQMYLFAGITARWSILQGLLDTDGHIRPHDRHIEYATASPHLAEGVAHLARSLGATCRIGRSGPNRMHYRLSLAFSDGARPFRLSRKADLHHDRPKYQPSRSIAAVEEIEPGPATCIRIAAPDGQFVTNGHVVTHNTIIFASLAERLQVDTLILAHRDELIQQAVAKLRKVWPDVPVGVIKGQQNNVHAPVMVASVQTLGRQRRLAGIAHRLSGPSRLRLCIIDEAHHATAPSYRRIIEALPDDCLLLGVTATPDRADGIGLENVFEEIVFDRPMLWGIEHGFLTDVRGKRLTLDLDLDALKVTAGDYADGELGDKLSRANAPGHALAGYQEFAAGRKAIVFTPTVSLAQQMSERFCGAGIPAGWVSGETEMGERRGLLEAFTSGTIRVLANCGVLTEGYDEPSTDCIIMARPTKSRGLYTQMVGRGVRKHPGKLDCLVLDLVGVSAKHDLVTMPDLFGLKIRDVEGGATVLEARARSIRMDQQAREQARLVATDIDLWEQKFAAAKLAWVEETRTGAWVLTAEGGFVALERTVVSDDGDQMWRAVVKPRKGPFRMLIDGVDLETAQGAGEDHVRAYAMRSALRKARQGGQPTSARQATALIRTDARWRLRPASDAAKRYARKIGVDLEGLTTAGQVADAIDARKAAQELARR